MKKYLFESTVTIRDFECDMQGVVNNAYYHNLLMQTRTEFLASVGIDRKVWSHERGIDFVTYKTSIQYKAPIQGGETFLSCLNMHREGARFVYVQDFRRASGELCMHARVEVVVCKEGKPTRGDYFANYLAGKTAIQEMHGRVRSTSKMPLKLHEVVYDYEMKVHDYECDSSGSATNTFVQHYLEVTRLEFMEEMGETFRKWHENGVDMMVSRIDIQFVRAMMSAEKFHSLMNIRQQGPRVIFEQQICRKTDRRLCVRALVEIVGLVNGELDTKGNCFRHFIENQVPAIKY